MTSWSYQINQWSAWQRSLLLAVTLFVISAAWYIFLEKPLTASHAAVVQQQARDQATLQEMTTLMQLQNNFIYKNNLQSVALRQVFQDQLSGINGLAISSYVDNSALILPAGANQFAQLRAAMNLSLLPAIQQLPATIVFSGGFNAFLSYLKALQNDSHVIYFDSVEFNMKRYPTAVVTMKVFALGG